MTSRFHIVVISPQGYAHSMALLELAETLSYGLQRLECIVTVAVNDLVGEDAVNIVLGAHLLSEEKAFQLRQPYILYNTEQMDEQSSWLANPGFTHALSASFEIWDYSPHNLALLRQRWPDVALRHVPVGYVPELSRIKAAPVQDIDVLFYGSINPRRKAIMDELEARKLAVLCVFGVYGAERDALIARSRLVLNVHYYESKIFETVRVSYLLANRKAVVCEVGEDTVIDARYRQAVAGVPYAMLAQTCVALLSDEQARAAQEARGFALMSSLPQEAFLHPALVAYLQHRLTADHIKPASMPRQMNLGSGKDFLPTHLNIDINGAWRPDVILDLSRQAVLPAKIQTERFGACELHAGRFDRIVANDVLEHVPDLVTLMTNCLDLLCVHGVFVIKVPYELSYGAWQDPTHVRAFNERSWLYYTDWFWYMGWTNARFDMADLSYELSALGRKLADEGVPLDMILLQPRAVDAMTVSLQKRLLTAHEKTTVERYMVRPAAQPATLPLD